MSKKGHGKINAAAKTLGREGGKKGGPARAKALTAGERQAIAAKGGRASHGKS